MGELMPQPLRVVDPKLKTVADVIQDLERQQLHPTRQLASELVAKYRRGSAIDPNYRFEDAPKELRQIIYNQSVRFHCRRSLLSRLLRRRGYVRRSYHPEFREETI